MRVITLLALGLTVIFTGSASSSTGGRLAYSLTQVGTTARSSWLESVALGGTEHLQLTAPSRGQFDDHPVWSPDGSRLAFVRANQVSSGVYIAPASGGSLLRILGLGQRIAVDHLPTPVWSADGTQVAVDQPTTCSSRHAQKLRLSVATSDGSSVRDLLALPRAKTLAALGGVQWAARGDKLVYAIQYGEPDGHGGCDFFDGPGTLYAINADGTGRQLIAEGGRGIQAFAASVN